MSIVIRSENKAISGRIGRSTGVRYARKSTSGPLECTVKFGAVTVSVATPRNGEVKRNIKAGQVALLRAKGKFLNPGIKIVAAKGIPLFSADPRNPHLLIRRMNGMKVKGTIKNGRFVEIQRCRG